MRVLVTMKSNHESEAGRLPSRALMARMGLYNEELEREGILLSGEGIRPSSEGARVTFAGDRRTVTDGPFAETKELIAGYWLWHVGSMDEAIAWVKRCPFPEEGEHVVEIRPVYEAEDFGDAFSPEAREREGVVPGDLTDGITA
ncbi:MAG: YciI family protein [Thermomicrobiales bacterium]